MRLVGQGVLWSRVGDEVVILDHRNDTYYGINPTGTALWDLLSTGCQREDLTGRLVAEFGITAEAADRDVEAFLDELRQQALLDDSDE